MCIRDRYLAVCTYQMMSQTLEEWKQEEAASLKSWREDFERKWKTSLDLGEAVREGLTLWYLRDHIEEQINQDIRSHFEKMFPDFAERFSFEIDRKAVEQAFADTEVSLTLPNWKIFGIFGSWRPERVRTVAERVKNREKVKARSEKIIRNLTAIYQNQLGIREKVQERMLEAPYHSLKEHVERMTPYSVSYTHLYKEAQAFLKRLRTEFLSLLSRKELTKQGVQIGIAEKTPDVSEFRKELKHASRKRLCLEEERLLAGIEERKNRECFKKAAEDTGVILYRLLEELSIFYPENSRAVSYTHL